MQLIKLNAINSTNVFLKDLIRQGGVKDDTVVTAAYQTDGRGQTGGNWVSEPGKNLMFSIFKTISDFKIDKQFYLSMATALAVYKALKKNNIPDLAVKWPNDILSAHKKIGGILIENNLKNGRVASSVIGVGLNVNQTDFSNLPQASSLRIITGITHEISEILDAILQELQIYIGLLEDHAFEILKAEYEACLFRIHQISNFKDKDDVSFLANIKGVTETGRLMLVMQDQTLKSFSLKEIKLLY